MKKALKSILSITLCLIMLLGTISGTGLLKASAATTWTINGKSFTYLSFTSATASSCWDYARQAYQYIWGSSFTNSRTESTNYLRNLSESELTLTADHAKEYISNAALGSVIRVCDSAYLNGDDGWGHSCILVSKNANGFTVINGGDPNSSSYSSELTYTWASFANAYVQQLGFNYIKYIKFPAGTTPYGSSTLSTFNGYSPANLGDDFYAFIGNNATGKYISYNGTNVCGVAQKKSKETLWRFKRQTDGTYQVSPYNNQSYVWDVGDAKTSVGANIQLLANSSNIAQKYYVYYVDGYYQFKLSYCDNFVDVNTADYNVHTFSYNSTYTTMKFNIERFTGDPEILDYSLANIGDDFYAFIGNNATGKYVSYDGTNVCGVAQKKSKETLWHFKKQSDGTYQISPYGKNTVWDVADYKTTVDANIQLLDNSSNGAQKFYIYNIGGYYYFKLSYCDNFIDVRSDNYNVRTYSYNSSYYTLRFNIEKFTGDIESLNHNHSFISSVTKNPTCTSSGTKKYTCTCGSSYIEVIPSTAHSFTNYVYNNDATTEKDGTETAKCNNCNEIDTRVKTGTKLIPGHTHSFVKKTTQKATCESDGINIFTCMCGNSYTEAIPAVGHADNNKDGFCDSCKMIINQALVNANPCKNAKINVASSKTIDYKSNVTIKATATGVPTDYYLAIYVNGEQVAKGTNSEVTYEAGQITADINYTVKVVDVKGNIQKDAGGKDLTKDGGKVTCKAGFFKKLIAFFKGLFGSLPTVTIKP